MTKITIDNRDFENVTIDTYQMYTGEGAYEMMMEYEEENARTEKREFNKYREVDYNMKEIVKGLANVSIGVLEEAIKGTPAEKMILEIKLLDTGSPRFYNYTTDWYNAEYTVDTVALDTYINAHTEAIATIMKEYTNEYDVNLVDNKYHASVCHIINNLIERDDYNMSMWEEEGNLYYENMTWTDEK